MNLHAPLDYLPFIQMDRKISKHHIRFISLSEDFLNQECFVIGRLNIPNVTERFYINIQEVEDI